MIPGSITIQVEVSNQCLCRPTLSIAIINPQTTEWGPLNPDTSLMSAQEVIIGISKPITCSVYIVYSFHETMQSRVVFGVHWTPVVVKV